MVICFKDKNFSGQMIKDSDGEVIIQLKPFNKDIFVRVKNGCYQYLKSIEVAQLLQIA